MADPASPSYKFYYFNLRARGETTRMILAAAGAEYDDHRVETDKWPALKSSMPWGQMPILEVDGRMLGESGAINRYLAQKFGLDGGNELDRCYVDSVAEVTTSFREAFSDAFAEKDEEKKAEKVKKYREETVPLYLNKLEGKIKNKGEYFLGDKLTWADLHFYACCELLNLAKTTVEEALANYPKLLAITEKVPTEPRIEAWLAKRPITLM